MDKDATEPKREAIFPPDYDMPPTINGDDDDSGTSGPGCIAWGIMLVFGLFIAVAIVVLSTVAGFNAGLDTARVTAAAATNANIARQCTILPTDIAAGRLDVVQSRFEALSVDGNLPQCASVFVQQATDVYNASQITATTPPTETVVPTNTPEVATTAPEVTTTAQPVVEATESRFDLGALLLEAQGDMASGNYDDAISTLDAIIAIDSTFEAQSVNSMLFSALTQQALAEFRTEGGSLAEGILLTNRAESFGNIQTTDLPFERSVAELYLDAQANLGLNYPLAISLLNQVVAFSPNYPRGTGQATTQLVAQYEAYGDALLLGGDPCSAESQFNNALSYRPNDVSLQSKISTAQTQCQQGALPTPVNPNATTDPNAPATSTAPPTVAPVGQSG